MRSQRARRNPQRRRARLTASTTALLCVAGFAGASSASAPAAAADDRADWTMMVYAVGDTDNVAEIMVQNLSQLAALPDDADVNVVVLLDLPDDRDPGAPTSTLPGAGEFDTAKLFLLDGGRFNEIRDLGEISMGRPDALANFIVEAADRYPADKYGLALFDHGGGSQGGYIDITPPQSAMTIPDIRTGMVAGMAEAGIDRFELLYHAACLMANYETATALAPLAETMAGSEELMFLYPLSPSGFVPLGTNGSGRDVATALVDGYRDLLDQPGLAGARRELMAMSVLDSDATERLDAALAAFADAVVPHMDELAVDIARARAKSLEFATPFGYAGFQLVDLGDFLRHLDGLPPDAEVARDAAFAALDGMVEYQLTGRGTQQTTGLNVFFPTDPRYVRDYFADGTAPLAWGRFLRAFLEAKSAAAPSGVSFADDTATVLEEGPGGIKIQGQLSAGEVTDADAFVLTRMGDAERAFSLVLPGYLDAGGQGAVQGVWDYSRVTLSDGTTSIPVTAILQPQSGGLIGTFETQYRNPDGATYDFVWRILVSSEGEIIAFDLADVSAQGAAAGTDPAPGGTLTPYLYVPGAGGATRVLSSESLVLDTDVFVDFTRLPAGTAFDMRVAAVDLAGRVVAASVQDQVQ